MAIRLYLHSECIYVVEREQLDRREGRGKDKCQAHIYMCGGVGTQGTEADNNI